MASCGLRDRWPALALLAGLALATPGSAWAHGSGRGMSVLLNSLLHPLTEPSQGLALLALGLWLAIHPASRDLTRRTLVTGVSTLALALLAAGLSGQAIAVADGGWPDHLLQAVGLAMALATAADRRAALPWPVPLACGITLLGVGLASPAGELRGVGAIGWAAGVALGSGLVVFYTAALARWARGRGTVGTIAPRVVASWLAASLVLVGALPLLPTVEPGPPTAPAATASGPQR